MREKDKAIVKSNKKVAKPTNALTKFAGMALGAVIGATSIFGAGLGVAQNKMDIPTRAEVIQNQERYGVDNVPYSSIIDNMDNTIFAKIKNALCNKYVTRLALPTNGDPIKLNINFDVNEEQKMALSNAVNNINYIFGDGKTDYKFEIEFNPSIADKSNIYNINVGLSQNFGDGINGVATFGLVSFSKKGVITNFGGNILLSSLLLKDNFSKTLSKLEYIFTHEFGHSVGLGDFYIQKELGKIEEGKFSLMSGNTNNLLIQKDDVALFLSSCQKNGAESEAKNEEFINNYSVGQCLTYAQKKDIEQIRSQMSVDFLRQCMKNNNFEYNNEWTPEQVGDNVYFVELTTHISNSIKYICHSSSKLIEGFLDVSYLQALCYENNSEDKDSINYSKLKSQIVNYNDLQFCIESNQAMVKFGNYLISVGISKDGTIEGTPYEICDEAQYNKTYSMIEKAGDYAKKHDKSQECINEIVDKIIEKTALENKLSYNEEYQNER